MYIKKYRDTSSNKNILDESGNLFYSNELETFIFVIKNNIKGQYIVFLGLVSSSARNGYLSICNIYVYYEKNFVKRPEKSKYFFFFSNLIYSILIFIYFIN